MLILLVTQNGGGQRFLSPPVAPPLILILLLAHKLKVRFFCSCCINKVYPEKGLKYFKQALHFQNSSYLLTCLSADRSR